MVDKHREASTYVIWSWGVPRARRAGNGGPVSHPGVAAFGVQRLERGRFGPQRAPHGELASDGDVLEDADGADDDGSGGCCRRGRPSIAPLAHGRRGGGRLVGGDLLDVEGRVAGTNSPRLACAGTIATEVTQVTDVTRGEMLGVHCQARHAVSGTPKMQFLVHIVTWHRPSEAMVITGAAARAKGLATATMLSATAKAMALNGIRRD